MTDTRVSRLAEKQRSDRAELDALLDDVHIAHVGVVTETGTVLVVPTAAARDGDRLLLHGSTGSPWLRRVSEGVDVCVTVTAYDGLVFARSAFESSIHYRSAMIFGACTVLADRVEKERALDVLTDALLPGRVAELRRPSGRELAATMVLTLPITDVPAPSWSLKVGAGWPDDPADDVAGPAWAGVVPARIVYGAAMSAPDLRDGIGAPSSVRALGRTET